MLSEAAVHEAADLIWRQWQEGGALGNLANAIRPSSRGEGYRIQARIDARTKAPLYGWKIAGTNPAGRAHIGIAEPIAGRLLAERVHQSGAAVPLGANRMRVAEPEFAFAMGGSLEPRTSPYGVDEVMALVERLHTAIEIPDSRFQDFVAAGEAQLIADNACAHEFVIGPSAPQGWRDVDLAGHAVRCEVVAKAVHDGSGRNVLDDPRLALTWLANELSRLGIPLRAGQIVTTGTAAVPLSVVPGDHVRADFGVLGRVEVRFV